MSDKTDAEAPLETSDPVDTSEPIDADFAPAPDPAVERKATRGGPGWLGVIVASVMSAGVGGAIGLFGSQAIGAGGSDAPAGLVEDVSVVQAAQTQTDQQLAKMVRDQAALEDRLRDEMAKLAEAGAGGESAASLAPLIAELDKVSKRLDEAVASGGNSQAVTALQARLEALESVEPGGEVTAEQTQRVLAALTERADQMETSIQAIRDAAPKDEERLSRVEEGVTVLQSGLTNATQANGADSEKLTGLIEQMRVDEAAARARAEAAATNAEAALAISSIIEASREGRAFESEYRRLRTLMPRAEAVRRLGAFAGETTSSAAMLRTSFTAASDAAREAVPKAQAGGWGWLTSVFGDAVEVRDGGDKAVVNAGLEAAETALKEDDLVGAVKAVSALSGPPAEALSAWTARANQRITLNAALEEARLAVTLGETGAP